MHVAFCAVPLNLPHASTSSRPASSFLSSAHRNCRRKSIRTTAAAFMRATGHVRDRRDRVSFLPPQVALLPDSLRLTCVNCTARRGTTVMPDYRDGELERSCMYMYLRALAVSVLLATGATRIAAQEALQFS